MIEVEIRARVKNLNSIKKRLALLGAKLVASERQIDKVFGREKDLDQDHQMIEGNFSARVRQKGSKRLVEFKEIIRTGAGLEFSSPIEDIAHGVHLLTKLDYTEAFCVDKTRDLYSYRGFEICLDKVKQLGCFVEIEKAVKSKNAVAVSLEKCKRLLEKIDPQALLDPRKYGDLMQDLINSKR